MSREKYEYIAKDGLNPIVVSISVSTANFEDGKPNQEEKDNAATIIMRSFFPTETKLETIYRGLFRASSEDLGKHVKKFQTADKVGFFDFGEESHTYDIYTTTVVGA